MKDVLIIIADRLNKVGVRWGIGVSLVASVKSEFKSKAFYQFNVNGIDIDIISAFIMGHDKGSYEFIFD